MLLAVRIAEALTLQEPTFFTDSKILATTAANSDIASAGPWTIRSMVADIQASMSFCSSRIFLVPRSGNYKAHHQAKLAVRLQNNSVTARCLLVVPGQCPVCDVLTAASVLPLKLLYVKCA